MSSHASPPVLAVGSVEPETRRSECLGSINVALNISSIGAQLPASSQLWPGSRTSLYAWPWRR